MNKNIDDSGIQKEELQQLEQVHDELRGQAHLLKPDAKRDFDQLERKFEQIKRDAQPGLGQPAQASAGARRQLFDSVKEGLARLSRSLQREPALSGAEEEEEEEH